MTNVSRELKIDIKARKECAIPYVAVEWLMFLLCIPNILGCVPMHLRREVIRECGEVIPSRETGRYLSSFVSNIGACSGCGLRSDRRRIINRTDRTEHEPTTPLCQCSPRNPRYVTMTLKGQNSPCSN